ncbi:hypothetical protein K502DRAFT_326391 [Neoconidiobolus thromboides FSU 785]|nr:hypothetical protein K502DRAFT_326391 [Neoconidiobolus thromboides FSU 785]
MKSTLSYTSFIFGLTLVDSILAQRLILRDAVKPDINKCLRANVYDWVQKSNPSVPPCWIENAGKYDCYEYKTGTQCDEWPGMFDIHKNPNGYVPSTNVKHPAQTCDRAGMGYICDITLKKCPPCWIQQGDKYHCYEYMQGTQKCDNWPGLFDVDRGQTVSSNPAQNQNNQVNVSKDVEIKLVNSDKKARPTVTDDSSDSAYPYDACHRGGYSDLCNVLVEGHNCPPCWIRRRGGGYDCFEYKENTKQCNNWPGLFDATKSRHRNRSFKSYRKNTNGKRRHSKESHNRYRSRE